MKKGNHGRNFMMKKYPTTFIKFLRSNFIYLVIEKNLGEMSHPNLHAKSSAKKFGGKPEDYIHLHEWMDETKGWFGDSLHRMFRHHSEGIFEMEKRFGPEFKNSDGKTVYTRYVGEQHVKEDCNNYIPSAKEWINNMVSNTRPSWMLKTIKLEFED
jgi:hypothetical protein